MTLASNDNGFKQNTISMTRTGASLFCGLSQVTKQVRLTAGKQMSQLSFLPYCFVETEYYI